MPDLSRFREIDVPPHIIQIFNEAFGEELTGVRLMVPASDISDADIWGALLKARADRIWDEQDEDDEDDEDDDEVYLSNRKKITWH